MNNSDFLIYLQLLPNMSEEERSELVNMLRRKELTEEQEKQLNEFLTPKTVSILGGEQQISSNATSISSQTNTQSQMSRDDKIELAAKGSREITQTKEPLILFVGPASCGKSMILMSLVDYLQGLPKSGYSISPNKGYILHDQGYETNCQRFQETLNLNTNTNIKIPLDKTVNEVLLDVKKNGIRKYTMLEAPGEHFFDIGNPTRSYQGYIKTIIQTAECPIYFVMLLDLHTPNNKFHDRNDSVRSAYEQRLIEIINDGFKKDRGDRAIFLYNKFDLHDDAITDNEAMSQLFRIYYTKIKDTSNLHYELLGTRLYPHFVELPYISGKYSKEIDNEGNTFETYRTTKKALKTISNLWNELK